MELHFIVVDILSLVLVSEGYQQPSVDLAKLPSAPRASRGIDVDLSKLPSSPPYTLFLGNLPYDVCEEDIINFCAGHEVSGNYPYIERKCERL